MKSADEIMKQFYEWQPLDLCHRPTHGMKVELRNEHGSWEIIWDEDSSWSTNGKEWRNIKFIGWKTL